jgi:hypothetical protein
MSPRKATGFIVLSLFLALTITTAVAHADEMDQAMKLTFSQPIAIPDQVLPAGTYWFMMAGHGEVQHVIQIFDGDRRNVIATLAVIDHKVTEPSGHVMLTLADRSPKPMALINLTYPGRIEGHSFDVSYPKQDRGGFSEYPKVKMKVGENGVIETVTAENTRQ